jgi:predicted anti-sigma-YlaC factor YlaD
MTNESNIDVPLAHGVPPCGDLLVALSDYISGEAAAELCQQIEAHLAECENCRVIVDTVRRTVTLCREITPPAVPTEVRRRLYQVLDLNTYLVE